MTARSNDWAIRTKERLTMKRLGKTVLLMFLLGIGVVSFTGCRTAHGFGEDMEKAGEEIQKGTN